MYGLIKTIHVITALISIGGFVLRGIWMLRDSPMLQQRWVKIVPHVNDTLLLASAITLAVMMSLSPMTQGWLMAKIVALLAYIALGMVALKPGRARSVRIGAWLAALLCFAYIVAVAVTKSPWLIS